MSGMRSTVLPLFPLPGTVFFPETQLRLHIFEPRYRQLVRDLLEQPEEERLVGIVLEKSGAREEEIYPVGTAGRLADVEFLPDGRSNIQLEGAFRFQLERELDPQPYRRGVILSADDSSGENAVLAQRLALAAREVLSEQGEASPVPSEVVLRLGELPFPHLVNILATEIDLPLERKLQLLLCDVGERAQSLLQFFESRRRLLDLLRAFRRFSEHPEQN